MKVINKLIEDKMDEADKLHLHNVNCIATLLASIMMLDDYDLMVVSIAAGIHDIGKIQLDQDVLNAERRLTEEEYKHVKQHSHNSSELFIRNVSDSMDTNLVIAISKAIMYHHERESGEGYPGGLKGRAIPIHAKIIAVADVYDALSSKRCYKDSWDTEEVDKHFIENSGKLYDRDVVKALLGCTYNIRKLYK